MQDQLSELAVPLLLSWITIEAMIIIRDKINQSYDCLNPAHVPCEQPNACQILLWYNNEDQTSNNQKATPLWTLGCHKPVVTFLVPLASNCQGSIGHTFTVSIHAENQYSPERRETPSFTHFLALSNTTAFWPGLEASRRGNTSLVQMQINSSWTLYISSIGVILVSLSSGSVLKQLTKIGCTQWRLLA